MWIQDPTSNIGSLVHHIQGIAFMWMILLCSSYGRSPWDIVTFQCHVTLICYGLDEVETI